jgi:hypothetical protein
VRRSRSDLMGIIRFLWFPLIPFQSPNHITTHLILLTQPLLTHPTLPHSVRADCLATNTEYCDRCTHAATQATNVARIKTEGTKGLLQGQVAG